MGAPRIFPASLFACQNQNAHQEEAKMPIRKSEKAANPPNIKKQLETLTGHKIDVSTEELLKVLIYPIGAYDAPKGWVAWRHISLPAKSCRDDLTLLDASGVSSTEANGTRVFLLSDFVCFPPSAFCLRTNQCACYGSLDSSVFPYHDTRADQQWNRLTNNCLRLGRQGGCGT
jgi:hypothetical protein